MTASTAVPVREELRVTGGAPIHERGSALAAVIRPSATGMRFSSRMPYEIWSALGQRITTHATASSWWLGDWLIYGERHYSQRYRAAIEATGLDYQTLRNYAMVARRFELSRRRSDLSFQHHAEVCALTQPEQERWLDLATEHHWSKQDLRLRIRHEMRSEQRPTDAHIMRVSVEAEREERWRRAANRSHCSFETWVINSLDVAARQRELEPGRERRAPGPPPI